MRKALLADAISDAVSEIQGLAEECREVVDNAGDGGLSQTQRIQTLDETASTLENANEPDVAECLLGIEVEYQDLPQRKRGYSRADRCGQACYILEMCIGALEDFEEKNPGDKADEAESLRGDLESLKDEAEGVEFPGMFG